ncbi:type II secretion system protein GspM [Marinomonas fungiae]|uniref:type II secretion system protein GspM n=1 Tax=Marinomonas fungiae TaxID=1137284 RepID=UPI003A8F9CD2
MKAWLAKLFEQSAGIQNGIRWYQSCSRRERVLLSLVLLLLAALLLYSFILAPLQQRQSLAEARLAQAQQQYQALQMNAQKLLSTRQQAGLEDRSSDALRRVLSQTAAAAQFSADRVQVEGDSRLQVWASEVSFAVVAKWLNGLANERVAIANLQIERVGEGMVNLRLTLD